MRPWEWCAFAALAGASYGIVVTACVPAADPMTVQDRVFVGTELEQDTACVETYKGKRAQTDTCRDNVHTAWDRYWRTQFDAGADR